MESEGDILATISYRGTLVFIMLGALESMQGLSGICMHSSTCFTTINMWAAKAREERFMLITAV
jgi:hypothetical protein